MCVSIYLAKSSLLYHQRMYHASEHKCNECDYVATIEYDLTIHIRREHLVVYKCDQCEFQTKAQQTFSDHIQTHTDNSRYKCNQCNSSFRSKRSLVVHQRYHNREAPYKCKQCKCTFIKREHLIGHESTHNGEQHPYKCDVCDFSCSTLSCYTQHKRTHSKTKTKTLTLIIVHRCTNCEFQSTVYSQLVVHTQNTGHTMCQKYACPYCKYWGPTSKSLGKHVRLWHPNTT